MFVFGVHDTGTMEKLCYNIVKDKENSPCQKLSCNQCILSKRIHHGMIFSSNVLTISTIITTVVIIMLVAKLCQWNPWHFGSLSE